MHTDVLVDLRLLKGVVDRVLRLQKSQVLVQALPDSLLVRELDQLLFGVRYQAQPQLVDLREKTRFLLEKHQLKLAELVRVVRVGLEEVLVELLESGHLRGEVLEVGFYDGGYQVAHLVRTIAIPLPQHLHQSHARLVTLGMYQKQLLELLLGVQQLVDVTPLVIRLQLLRSDGALPVSNGVPVDVQFRLLLGGVCGGCLGTVLLHQLHQIVLKPLVLSEEAPIHVDVVLVEEVLPTDPAEVFLCQHPSEQILGLEGDPLSRGNLQLKIADMIQKIRQAPLSKRWHSKQHLVQHHTQRPNIALAVIQISVQDLRSHIDWRPQHCLRQVIQCGHLLAEPEIRQLQSSLFDQNIIRLDIPVIDAMLTQYPERTHQLPHHQQRLPLLQVPLRPDPLVQSSALTIFIHHVDVVYCLNGLEELDDVGVVLKEFQGFDLVPHAVGELGNLLEF